MKIGFEFNIKIPYVHSSGKRLYTTILGLVDIESFLTYSFFNKKYDPSCVGPNHRPINSCLGYLGKAFSYNNETDDYRESYDESPFSKQIIIRDKIINNTYDFKISIVSQIEEGKSIRESKENILKKINDAIYNYYLIIDADYIVLE